MEGQEMQRATPGVHQERLLQQQARLPTSQPGVRAGSDKCSIGNVVVCEEGC